MIVRHENHYMMHLNLALYDPFKFACIEVQLIRELFRSLVSDFNEIWMCDKKRNNTYHSNFLPYLQDLEVTH